MTDNNLTPGQEGDAVAVYLAGVRKRADYSARYEFWESGDVPRLLGAVEAVKRRHYPVKVYGLSVLAHDSKNPPRVWCGHTLAETEDDRHMLADDNSVLCLDKHEATVCAECWDEGDEQVIWPCPTYRDITAELLRAKETAGG